MMFPFQFWSRGSRQARELRALDLVMRGRRFLAQRPRIPAPVDHAFFSRDRTGIPPVRVIVVDGRMRLRAQAETVERVMFSKN